MALIIIPLFYFFADYSTNNDILQLNKSVIFILFAVASGIQVLKQQLSEMLIAAKQMYVDNILNLIFTIFRFILILLLIPHFGILTIFSVYLLIAILNFIIAYIRVKKVYPFLKIKLSLFDIETFKKLLSNGLYFSLGSIATILILKFDNFFLSKELSLEFVSKLYISIRLVIIGQKIIEILFNNFRPYIASFHGKKEYDKITIFFNIGSKLNFIMSILGFSLILLMNKYFVYWWVGKDFYLGDNIVILYVIFYLTYTLSQPIRIIMVSTLTKIKNISIVRFIEGFIRVIIIYIFYDRFGIKILPISSFVLTAMFQYIYLTYLVSKENKWNYKKEIFQNVIFLLLPISITLLTFVLNADIVIWIFVLSALLISLAIFYNQRHILSKLINNIK